MSKIPLLSNNKEMIIGICVGLGFLVLVIIQIIVLTPSLIRVYSPIEKSKNKQLIDSQTVNEALRLLKNSE